MSYKVIIIDDEPIARRGITLLLEENSNFQIIDECGDGKVAAEKINKLKPDLVFLDIEMPEYNGFQVLEKVKTESMPIVIFTTAYDEFALEAFKANALDYLLKPVKKSEFNSALNRALKLLIADDTFDLKVKLDNLLKNSSKDYLKRISYKSKGKIKLLDIDKVEWFSAEGDYIGINTNSKKYLERERLSNIEKKLDPKHFVQIHRSTIVNINFIKEIESLGNGDYVVFLKSGIKLTASRTFRENLLSSL